MTVHKTYSGHQTRYELREAAGLSCVLSYTADPDEPAVWKILMPGPDGAEDLYGAQQFSEPSAAQLQRWLTGVVGEERAAELADAVDSAPPPPSAWSSRG